MPHDILQWIVLGAGGAILASGLGWVMKRVVEIATLRAELNSLRERVGTENDALKDALEHKISDLEGDLAKVERDWETRRKESRERDKEMFNKLGDLTTALNAFTERMATFEGVVTTLRDLVKVSVQKT